MPRAERSAWVLEGCDMANTVLYHAGQRQRYGPFGKGQAYGAAGYTGQYQEPCTGYALGNGRRLYRPSLRRFCQPDTLSPFERGGLNSYAYCLSEPVNRHDPSGQEALDVLGHIAGALSLIAYGAMMFTGYRLAPPSKLVVAVDTVLMTGSIIAWSVGLTNDNRAAQIASLTATLLTTAGRGALAVQWGRQARHRLSRASIELTRFSSPESLTRERPHP